MELQKALFCRKSVRTYTGERLTEEELDYVLRAAVAAPVGCGEYEKYHITVIEDPAFLRDWEAAVSAENGRESHPFYGAPTLVLLSAVLPGESMLDNRYYSSAACMTENMSLAATELGVGCCLVWGAVRTMNRCPEILRRAKLPEGFTPVCSVILGRTKAVYGERRHGAIETEYIR